MPFLGHSTTHSLSQHSEFLGFPLPSFHRLNICAQRGARRLPASEALQKGKGDWTALCYSSLPYFISPFVKRPLYAQVDIYLAAKKWYLAAAVVSHLVKADPENPAAWINLAYAVRRDQNIEAAEAILLKARALHLKSALIAFNLACYASVAGHMEEAKARLPVLGSLSRLRLLVGKMVGTE